MRKLDIVDTRDKLLAYVESGLLRPAEDGVLPLLPSAKKSEGS
jgi:hypothetical protein